MFIHFAFARRSHPSTLGEGQFTRDEVNRIRALRRQYLTYPDSFKLDVNYRRAHFVRWLVRRGYLREGLEVREDVYAGAYHSDKWATIQRWM